MLAQRRASRILEIQTHGRPVSYSALHKSKKVYDRKRLKKAGINFTDDLLFFVLGIAVLAAFADRRAMRCVAVEQSPAFGMVGRSPDGPNDGVCGAVRLSRRPCRREGLKRRRSGSGVGSLLTTRLERQADLSMSQKMSNFVFTKSEITGLL